MRISVIKVTGHADVADAASLNRSGTPRCDVVARLGVAFGEGQAGHEVVLRCAVPVPLVVLDVDDVAGSCSLLSLGRRRRRTTDGLASLSIIRLTFVQTRAYGCVNQAVEVRGPR